MECASDLYKHPHQNSPPRLEGHVDCHVVCDKTKDTSFVATERPPDLRMQAAGILPYTKLDDGSVRFLIGMEQYGSDAERYADFGGKRERTDIDIVYTAARECYQETMGVIHQFDHLEQRLRNGDAVWCADMQMGPNNVCYRMYVLKIKLEDYNRWFQIIRVYLRTMGVQMRTAEKRSMMWVTPAELIEASKISDWGAGSDRVRTSKYAHTPPGFRGKTRIGRRILLRPNFARSVIDFSRRVDLEKLP